MIHVKYKVILNDSFLRLKVFGPILSIVPEIKHYGCRNITRGLSLQIYLKKL